ncbi:DUF3626 domain-containing protein [Vibrio chagasii]|nr:DUF3626 domain-containing protein [Vibrio chagasii]
MVRPGAYDDTPGTLRPKYGALNYRNYETGASPRFGSCYFQLKAEPWNELRSAIQTVSLSQEDCGF